MKLHILLFCVWIGIFTVSCKKDSSNAIEASFMRIYLNSKAGNSDYKVFDVFKTQDKGLLLFGGINTKTRFENGGFFFLQKFDEKGNSQTLLVDTTVSKGMISNMIESNGNYFFVRSLSDRRERIEVIINGKEISVDKKTIALSSSVLRICSDNNSGFYLMASDTINGYHTINFSHASADFSSNYGLGDFQFAPTSFEGYESNLMSEKLDNYLLLSPFQGSFISNSPSFANMSLNYSGDNQAIFKDANYWICGLVPTSTNTLILTTVNTLNDQLYFVPATDGLRSQLDTNAINTTKKQISGIDVSSKVLTILSPDEKNVIVIGTTFSGQLSFNTFDINGNNAKQRLVGQTYKYEIGSAIWYDNQTLLIAGTTKVAYKYQRAFVVKIPLSELL